MITGGDCVTGHDPATGKELWRANGLNPDNDPFYRIVASPVVFKDIVYAPTRVKPLLAIQSRRARRRHQLASACGQPQMGPMCRLRSPTASIFMSSMTGESCGASMLRQAEIYGQQRIKPATYSSSPVLADDKLYVTNEEGLTTVLRRGRSLKCWPRTLERLQA